MTHKIRKAKLEDAGPLSDLIRTTLYISNIGDYGEENIKRVAENLDANAMANLIQTRFVLVAENDGQISGTAAHFEQSARTVFVHPDLQNSGLGRKLMQRIISRSIDLNEDHLTVTSSIFAQPFYSKLGFETLKELWHGDERTFLMRLDHPSP